jgi:hypothetical protein
MGLNEKGSILNAVVLSPFKALLHVEIILSIELNAWDLVSSGIVFSVR